MRWTRDDDCPARRAPHRGVLDAAGYRRCGRAWLLDALHKQGVEVRDQPDRGDGGLRGRVLRPVLQRHLRRRSHPAAAAAVGKIAMVSPRCRCPGTPPSRATSASARNRLGNRRSPARCGDDRPPVSGAAAIGVTPSGRTVPPIAATMPTWWPRTRCWPSCPDSSSGGVSR